MSEPIDLEAKLSLEGKFPGDRGHGPEPVGCRAASARAAPARTVLSVYNTGDHCWEHTPRSPYLLNVRRFRPARRQTA